MTISEHPRAKPPLTLPAESPAARRIVMTDNRIDSRDLFSGGREIIITHGDGVYRLRLTSQNKLILTK